MTFDPITIGHMIFFIIYFFSALVKVNKIP